MVTLPRNVSPNHIRRLLIAYCLSIIAIVLIVGYGLFQTQNRGYEKSAKPKNAPQVKAIFEKTLPAVPPSSWVSHIDKRVRQVEMPPEEAVSIESAQPEPPQAPPPVFTIGKLIATFVEDSHHRSHAVFQLPTGTVLLGVGQTIDQEGEQFTLHAVERRSVTFIARGIEVVVAMQE
jgi:hypothetical protein